MWLRFQETLRLLVCYKHSGVLTFGGERRYDQYIPDQDENQPAPREPIFRGLGSVTENNSLEAIGSRFIPR